MRRPSTTDATGRVTSPTHGTLASLRGELAQLVVVLVVVALGITAVALLLHGANGVGDLGALLGSSRAP